MKKGMTALKRFKMISVLIVAIFFLGNAKCVQAIETESLIYKNVYIEDINVSNLTKEEAIIKINEVLGKNNKIDFNYGQGNCKVYLKDLGVSYDVQGAVEQAFNVDKKENFFKDLRTKISLNTGRKENVKLDCSYDLEKIDSSIESICEKLYVPPVSATIKMENGVIISSGEEYGKTIDKLELKKKIISRIEGIYNKEVKISILNIEPKFKLEQLSKIDTVLGTYETSFNPEIKNRVNNIEIASNATNNILLGKGEEFSFNSILIKSKKLRGMKEAPVIINGKMEKGLGGGICQVSSTIYNAALYAGMDITNIRNHSIPSAYVSKGRDATVSLGDVDFKFKNKFNTPILIYNEVYENKIVSTIYGSIEDKKEIEIVTEIIKVLPNKVEQKDSEELYIGQKEIKEEGRKGYKVNTFRIYNDENNNKTKEFVYESYYPPMNKVIIHGTKRKEIKRENKHPINNNENKKINIRTEYI
ncbi:MAG: VanW family protein [Peptostreptococcaceae bacterium]